jgi:hypothetical protein
MTKGITHIPANTRRGRQLASQNSRINHADLQTVEQRVWNAKIEAERKAKKEAKYKELYTPRSPLPLYNKEDE